MFHVLQSWPSCGYICNYFVDGDTLRDAIAYDMDYDFVELVEFAFDDLFNNSIWALTVKNGLG